MTLLRHLTLSAPDPAALRSFYADDLGLPVSDTADGFAVAVGASSMKFRQAEPGATPTYHIAFTVPGGTIDDAAAWLGARSPLLSDDGRTQFRYEFLDATAVYAADPAGNILELIARDGVEGATNPFDSHSLRSVAEIGLVVEDVPGAAAALDEQFDLQGSADESFAYLGGDDGAFVLVSPGRPWYPTDTPAMPAPLTVVAAGEPGTLTFEAGPVSVVGVTEP